MGYRLSIDDPENHLKFYGTKLYGYTDEHILQSYNYLESIGKVDYFTTFSSGIDNEMTLTPEQFREFMHLYREDVIRKCAYDMIESNGYNAIEEMLVTESDKIIRWE